jgi:hypothetical protein
MAASPLAAALLGGNENAAALDPTMLQVQPELSLASVLAKQGIDTSAAYPMQAIARPFQALAGVVMQQDALNTLKDAYGSAIQAAQKIYPPTTPLGKALASGNPIIAIGALNQIPKAELMREEPHALGPEQQLWAGGGPVAGLSPQQSVQYYGARAGAEAARRAAFEPGGPATEQTPYGPREIELTAAERAAAAQRRAGGTSMPSAAIPQPQAQAPQQAQQAPAQQAQVPQALAPQAPPVGTIMGKPIAHPEFEPLIHTNSDEVDKTRAVADKAQQTNGTAKLVLDLLPKVQTGWTTETKLQAENILKGLGIDPAGIGAFDKIDLASGQVLSKKFLDLSMGAMRSDFGGSREAFGAMQMFRNAYPSIGTDPDAVRLQTNVLRMDNLRGSHLANEKTSYLQNSINDIQNTGKYRGLNGFNEQFAKSNAPELYVHAAEAMSGPRFAQWDKIKSTAERNAIVRLIPPGEQFYAPDRDGKMKWFIKPGAAQ